MKLTILIKSLPSKIKSGACILIIGQFVGISFSFLCNASLARVLLPREMGQYFLIISLVTFFSILCRFGIDNVALKEVADANNSKQAAAIKQTCIRLCCIFSVTTISTTALCYFFLRWLFIHIFKQPELVQLVIPICVWIAALSTQLILGQILRALGRFWSFTVLGTPALNLLNTIFIVRILFCRISTNLLDILYIIVSNLILLNIMALITLFYAAINPSHSDSQNTCLDDVKTISKLVSMSLPMFVAQTAMFIAAKSDIWMLSAYLPGSTVALYGAASKLVFLSTMSLSIANGVLPPLIAELRNYGKIREMENLLRNVATVASLPSLFLLGVFSLVPSRILTTVFGGHYGQAGSILRILAFGQFTNLIVGSCGHVLIMFGENKLIMKITLVIGCATIASSYILLNSGFGVKAIALVCSSMMVCQQLMLMYFAYKRCGVLTCVRIPWH